MRSSASSKSRSVTVLSPRRAAVSARFVGKVRQVGAAHTGRGLGQRRQVGIRRQGNIAGMDLEDRLATTPIGQIDDDLAIETAGSQQRRIEHIRTVGSGQHDHRLVWLEAVHGHQQLVQGLLTLVIAAADPVSATTLAADGIQLVDEDDRGGHGPGLGEEVTHAAGANTHEHLHELRGADAQEGHACLTGDRPRQQSLAGARRANQQHALGDMRAKALVLRRIAQEIDLLTQFGLGRLHAGNIREGGAGRSSV